MNKREAKRTAYVYAAGFIEGGRDNCWFDGHTEQDTDKIREALNEIIRELETRADRLGGQHICYTDPT